MWQYDEGQTGASASSTLHTRSRSRGDPDWTVQDMLILVNEIAAVEGDCQNALSSYQKWSIIAENCTALEVVRKSNQCRRKWESLFGEYKLVKEWESNPRGDSYWSLGRERRKETGLPLDFDKDLYKAIDDFINAQGRADSDPEKDPEAAEIDVFHDEESGPKPKRQRCRSISQKAEKIERRRSTSQKAEETVWRWSTSQKATAKEFERHQLTLTAEETERHQLTSRKATAEETKRHQLTSTAEETERHQLTAQKVTAEETEQHRLTSQKVTAEEIERHQLTSQKATAEETEQHQLTSQKVTAEEIEQHQLTSQKATAEEIEQHQLTSQKATAEEAKQPISEDKHEKSGPIVEEMEQILEQKLKENTELIHAILAGNFAATEGNQLANLHDEETLKAEAAKCKAEKLIATLGDLTKNLQQLCHVIEEG